MVPDRPDPRVQGIVQAAAAGWSGPLRLELVRRPEREVLPRLGDPGRNHGYQIVSGVVATGASHVVLHDADLFLLEDTAHDRQYERAVARGLDVLGISPARDPWFAERGRQLAATWEMTARTEWLRAAPPWRLLAHEDVVLGESHVLDTTFWGQLQTGPARVGIEPLGGVVHFKDLISAYRTWASRERPFHDEHAALLVIRVLTDLFDVGDSADLPSLADLTAAAAGVSGQVSYEGCTAEEYARTRGLLAEVLSGAWASAEQRARAVAALAPFDARFGWKEDAEAVTAVVPPAGGPPDVADVAVVIPVHNRADLLPASIAAVLAQVPPPAEVIVVDDESSDDSAEVAASLGVRVIRRTGSEGNPGPPRNVGMHAATATWVAFCDSDDLWAQGHLAELIAHATPDVVLVSAPGRESTGGWLGNARGKAVRLDAAGILAPGVNLIASATMVRRQEALQLGGFRSRIAEDLDLWLRMLERGTAVLTARPTVVYQYHPGQMSQDGGVQAAAETIVWEHRDDPWFGRALGVRWSSQLRWDELRSALRRQDNDAALASARQLIRSPTALTGVASLIVYRRRLHWSVRRNPTVPSAARSAHPGDDQLADGTEVHPGD